MGKSSSQTIGYWYKWAIHFGWCRGPVDAVLQIFAGGKSCWVGRQTASGTISINQPQLWGGASGLGGQGGLDGDMDILMGEPAQAPNAYLTATFGAQQSGHRGKLTTVWKGGRYGAFSANPQPMSLKVERILADWESGSAWYAEKARIKMDGAAMDAIAVADTQLAGLDAHTVVDDGVSIAINDLDPSDQVLITKPPGLLYTAWSLWPVDSDPAAAGNPWINTFSVTNAEGVASTHWTDRYPTADAAFAAAANLTEVLTGSTGYRIWLYDAEIPNNRGGFSAQVVIRRSLMWAMNPAHMIYEALTRADMSGEPVGLINDASFRAAADTLFDEGFGLCTDYDSDQETPQDFIQRVANAAGLNVSQSRVDGLYYIDLIRPVADTSGLPIIAESDVTEFSQETSLPVENVNAVSVEYLDVSLKDTITTPPVYAMGAVRAAGQVIPDTRIYHEIPSQALALRVARRDCEAASIPLAKFTLKVLRKFRGLRPGMHVRLQMPSDGIADTVLLVGGVDHGTQDSGELTITAVQDVFAFADAAYVAPSTGLWAPPATDPAIITQQAAIEAPYIYLAGRLSNADLAALCDDAGYLAAAAARPANGLNFTLDTAVLPTAYADRAQGDWCATARVPAVAFYKDAVLTLADVGDADRIAVGDWALWDSEIVQVQTFDADTDTLTVGRACADTLPAVHDAGSRLLFCGASLAADPTEYADGDAVSAALLTNLGSARLAVARATALAVSMASRAARPYPPAGLTFNGKAYADFIEGELTLAWARRNRVTQANLLLDQTGADVTPEAGQTETLRIYDETGTLARTVSGTTATGYTYALADESADRGGGGGSDPYYASVVSLLHFDGANGSTTFTDERGASWTRTGTPVISNAQSKFGGASGLFGAGNAISTPNNASFSITGDFTIEAFIYPTSTMSVGVIESKRPAAPPAAEWTFTVSSGKIGMVAWTSLGAVINMTGTTTIALNAWAHVALSRNGATWRLFLNGVLESTATFVGPIPNTTAPLWISNDATATGRNFIGYIDELRITQGVGRYTAAFTPPTAPFSILPVGTLNSRLRIELESLRDGLTSREKYNWTVLRIIQSVMLPQPPLSAMDAATKLFARGFGRGGNGDPATMYVWQLDLAAGTLTRLDTAKAAIGGEAYFAGTMLVNMTSSDWRSRGAGVTNFTHIDLSAYLANMTLPTVFQLLGTKACVFSYASGGEIQLAWSSDGITWANPAGAKAASALSVAVTTETLLGLRIYPALSGWHATLLLGDASQNLTRVVIKSSTDLTSWTTLSDATVTDGYWQRSSWFNAPLILGAKYYRWKILDDAAAVAGGTGFGTKLVHQQFQLLSSTDDVTYAAIGSAFPVGSVSYGQTAPRVVGSAIQVPGHRALYSYDGTTITTIAHRLAVGTGWWNSAWLALCGPSAAATTDFSTFASKIPTATGWIAPFQLSSATPSATFTAGDGGYTVSGFGPAQIVNGAAVSSDDGGKYYAEVKLLSLPPGAVSGQPRLAITLSSETWDQGLSYTSDGALTYSAPYTDAANQKNLTATGMTVGDVIGVTLDTTAKTCTFAVNGVAQTALAYNPPAHQPCRFLFTLTLNAAYVRANVGQETFAYPPAAGVKSWGVLT